MAEGEVNYASVVFTTNKQRSPEDKSEETVYDEVKGQKQTAEKKVSAGFLSDNKGNRSHRLYQCLACCLGILCVALLSVLVALSVYIALILEGDVSDLQQLSKNHTSLLAVNHDLINLNNNLTAQLVNLTQTYTVLETTFTNLSEEIQQLETTRNNLTEQIRKLENKLNELNISRAQWSLDNYCPKGDKGRQCNYCQNGWAVSPFNSSCYAINNAQPPNQKTWEEAQEDCRGKNSDLAVIVNEEEKTFTTQNSWSNQNIRGYWIGLRGENRTWKWVDGSFLNQSSWIQQSPTDGSCVTSLQGEGWKSVNCSEKNAWICKKKALSV